MISLAFISLFAVLLVALIEFIVSCDFDQFQRLGSPFVIWSGVAFLITNRIFRFYIPLTKIHARLEKAAQHSSISRFIFVEVPSGMHVFRAVFKMPTYLPTSKRIWRPIELTAAISGTLIWGYGDLFVKAVCKI